MTQSNSPDRPNAAQTAKVLSFPLSPRLRGDGTHEEPVSRSPKSERDGSAPVSSSAGNPVSLRRIRNERALEDQRRRVGELMDICSKWSITPKQLRQLAEFMERNPFIKPS